MNESLTSTEQLLAENPAFHAWWFLARAYHSIAAKMTRFFEERGITGPQFGVLRCLADADPEGLMLSDLSRRLMVSCGNVTGVVDRMEHAGYLRRERCPGDRRVVRARLTEAGRAFFYEIRPAHQARIREVMATLSAPEQEALAQQCRRLHESLEAERLLGETGVCREGGVLQE